MDGVNKKKSFKEVYDKNYYILDNAGGNESSTRDFNNSQDGPSAKKRKIVGITIDLDNPPIGIFL